MLYTGHAMLASAFSAPTIAITEDEAKKLADASQRVARHYDLPGIAQETKDWISLIMACGAVYGPRMSAAWMEKKMAKAARDAANEQDGENVIELPRILG